MFSGKDYSSFSQHLRLTLTISGHKSNMRDIGTTQVLNGIEEKKKIFDLKGLDKPT